MVIQNLITFITLNFVPQSSTSLPREEVNKSPADSSLFSLYNQPQGMDEYVSDVYGQVLFHEKLSKR